MDPSSNKVTVIAQQEVAEGAIQVYDPATDEVEFEDEEEEE